MATGAASWPVPPDEAAKLLAAHGAALLSVWDGTA